MNRLLFTRNVLTAVLFALVFTSLAHAQATRTWVSGVGDDANPCSRTAPCKTFAGAISKTAVAGEIDCLDPGGFGALTITKSITIDCRGTFGSVLVSGTPGIVINDGTNAAIVNIRGVKFNGLGTGTNGISWVAGFQLHLEDVTIFNFSQNGINVNLGGVPAGSQHFLTVTNSTIQESGQNGIFTQDNVSANIAVAINKCRIYKNGASGIQLNTNSKATIRDSDISFNNNGIAQSGGTSEAFIENNSINGNGSGVLGGGSSIARVSNNHVTRNNVGFNLGGGTIRSFGNNKVDGNTSDGSVTTTIGTGHGTL